MEGLKKVLKTKKGKIQVFKESRDMLISLTDALISDSSNLVDIGCSLGPLSKRLDVIAEALCNEFYEKQNVNQKHNHENH